VLIWLAKAGRLDLLKEQYKKILIPPEVYAEVVVDGLKEGYPDAHAIKEAVEEGWIMVEANEAGERKKRLTNDLREIHEGEASALVLALSRSLPILIDESSGRTLAEALGLSPKGTLYVVLRALHSGKLTGSEARDAIALMVSSGFRIEPSLLERVLREVTLFSRRDGSLGAEDAARKAGGL
jgi:predicted nucleic acid-binding protein